MYKSHKRKVIFIRKFGKGIIHISLYVLESALKTIRSSNEFIAYAFYLSLDKRLLPKTTEWDQYRNYKLVSREVHLIW